MQSIGIAGNTGATGITGATGPTGQDGAAGLLTAGSAVGNTPYWDGTQWVVNSSNIFNAGGSVGIGTSSPDASAAIDVSSTTKGALIPRMTTNERNAIASPAEGLQIFNTSDKCLQIFQNNFWTACLNSSCGFLFKDLRDGNTYQTVQIGSQCWMAENLKYLPIVHRNSEFALQATNSQSGYGIYGYDGNDLTTAKSDANFNTYGVLYNWYAATNACPSGWHLPTDDEWKQLELYLGMDTSVVNHIGWRGTDEGSKLKEAGILHWTSPNTGATNSSGFLALPGGRRNLSGNFSALNNGGSLWSATEDNFSAWRRYLVYNLSTVYRYADDKGYGFTVRCLMN